MIRNLIDKRNFHHWKNLAQKILLLESEFSQLSAEKLLRRSQSLSWSMRSLRSKKDFDKVLVPAFGLLREASKRVHNQAHYDIQLIGGIALCKGLVIEMQTGEGKSLTALLPAYLHALFGRGCHVFTSNDYLATRDAAFAKPIFEMLGVSVGCVHQPLKRQERKLEYDCDVTFGTAREFGFDFLKDNLVEPGDEEQAIQREPYFALVDEADSVMIDDARTPLVISAIVPGNEEAKKISQVAVSGICELREEIDYQVNPNNRSIQLTTFGCQSVIRIARPHVQSTTSVEDIYKEFEHALVAERFMIRNRDYIVNDGEVEIVDESTGRIAEGRKWENGLHQAIEAKENVEITDRTEHLAKITMQSFFRRYENLAGLTGTAYNSRSEFKKIYSLNVTVIPTRLPPQRKYLAPRVFSSRQAKYEAVLEDVRKRSSQGQAILIGTPSVKASQQLSQVFTQNSVHHEVLNCIFHEDEADIISRAGQAGKVTIATNMAGRGTDIKVNREVQNNGGLHVISTEVHSSARIDRQLVGRSARQGEPGSCQVFVSGEDELFDFVANSQNLRRQLRNTKSDEVSSSRLVVFKKAQRKLERLHEVQRKQMLDREESRNKICDQIGLNRFIEFLE